MNSFSVILNSKAIMSNVPCYSVLTQDLSLAYQCVSDESVNFETKSSAMLLSVYSSEMKKIAMKLIFILSKSDAAFSNAIHNYCTRQFIEEKGTKPRILIGH